MPKVSVIMPSLNVQPYIKECIESVLSQTLEDIEVFCVDAGSTDGTLEILNEYASKDHRINVIHSERKSYGHQVNLGMDAATGEYMGIVETDDYITKEMIQELYLIACSNDLDFVKGDFYRFYGDGAERSFDYAQIANETSYDKVLDPSEDPAVMDNNTIYSWAGIYKLSFLRKNRVRHNESAGASYQDNGFWFQTFSQAHRVMFVKKPYYYLRRDNPNSSFRSKAKVYCGCEEYDFIREFLKKDPRLEKKYAPVCAYQRYRNNMFTLGRISDENKLEFLRRFASDFAVIKTNGELDPSLFTSKQWKQLCAIVDSPEEYFYRTVPFVVPDNDELETLSDAEKAAIALTRLDIANHKIAEFENRLDALKKSTSFRIGAAITAVPRKLARRKNQKS